MSQNTRSYGFDENWKKKNFLSFSAEPQGEKETFGYFFSKGDICCIAALFKDHGTVKPETHRSTCPWSKGNCSKDTSSFSVFEQCIAIFNLLLTFLLRWFAFPLTSVLLLSQTRRHRYHVIGWFLFQKSFSFSIWSILPSISRSSWMIIVFVNTFAYLYVSYNHSIQSSGLMPLYIRSGIWTINFQIYV